MKKIVFLIFLFCTFLSFGQKTNSVHNSGIDKRVELLSIAFRLAESREYSSEIFKLYTNRINEHYSAYKDHELINFIKEIRKERGVSFDAVMKMAVHLDKDLNPLVEFTDEIPESRWGRENAYEFVRLLKEFYKDTNSEEFFRSNKDLYKTAAERFKPVYEKLDTGWYTRFYGEEPTEEFVIVNGLGNGGGNFGPSVEKEKGQRVIYAIMGAWNTDEAGMVKFAVQEYFPTLLHEFNHSFVNDLIANNREAFKSSGERIFEVVKKEMNNGAYSSWETMVNEALVRAAVIKYLKDHNFPQEKIGLETSEQVNRGFIWIEDLVLELEKYDSNRDRYPTLESYMTQLSTAYKDYAQNIQTYLDKKNDAKPHLVSISEFKNGSKNVDAGLKQVSLNFDRPFTGANFIRPGGEKAFPNFTNLSFSEDRKTVILNWDLEAEQDYEFILIGITPNTHKAKAAGDYPISFSTK